MGRREKLGALYRPGSHGVHPLVCMSVHGSREVTGDLARRQDAPAERRASAERA